MHASVLTSCQIPVAVLRASPFSLNWGTSVFAKVVATNAFGSSLASEAGNGGVIITTPDPPTGLNENIADREKNSVLLKWTPPVFKGGD
jgi:hypothetical protein